MHWMLILLCRSHDKYLATRIKQHLNSDKNSHIYKHLKGSKTCEDKCSNNSFEIIDSAQTQYSLKLKDSLDSLAKTCFKYTKNT